MLDSLVVLYVIGAFVCFLRASALVAKGSNYLLHQSNVSEEMIEQIFENYFGKILFQVVMMLVFPPSFWIYTKWSNSCEDQVFVSTGLLTVVWLLLAGIAISVIFYLLTHKVSTFKVFFDNQCFVNKEFFWVMCPLLYGIIFYIHDRTIFYTILALVLGKYIWMDFFAYVPEHISPKNIVLHILSVVKASFNRHKTDLLLLLYQSVFLFYLFFAWYLVKDNGSENTTIYFAAHFLILGRGIMPMLDRLVFRSMRLKLSSESDKK